MRGHVVQAGVRPDAVLVGGSRCGVSCASKRQPLAQTGSGRKSLPRNWGFPAETLLPAGGTFAAQGQRSAAWRSDSHVTRHRTPKPQESVLSRCEARCLSGPAPPRSFLPPPAATCLVATSLRGVLQSSRGSASVPSPLSQSQLVPTPTAPHRAAPSSRRAARSEPCRPHTCGPPWPLPLPRPHIPQWPRLLLSRGARDGGDSGQARGRSPRGDVRPGQQVRRGFLGAETAQVGPRWGSRRPPPPMTLLASQLPPLSPLINEAIDHSRPGRLPWLWQLILPHNGM